MQTTSVTEKGYHSCVSAAWKRERAKLWHQLN